MTIDIIEREITPEELAHMKRGFDEHGLEHGVQPDLQKRFTVVAMNKGSFIGCASGLTNYNWFYITDMYLDKNQRGRGLGAKLIERLERLVAQEGISKIYTWTTEYEAPAFYKKQGYTVFAEFENYYPNGYSRIGFKKTLNLKP